MCKNCILNNVKNYSERQLKKHLFLIIGPQIIKGKTMSSRCRHTCNPYLVLYSRSGPSGGLFTEGDGQYRFVTLVSSTIKCKLLQILLSTSRYQVLILMLAERISFYSLLEVMSNQETNQPTQEELEQGGSSSNSATSENKDDLNMNS